MILGGFIPTTVEPNIKDLAETCSQKGIEYRINGQTIDVYSELFRQKITLSLNQRGIRYRLVMTEFLAYPIMYLTAVLLVSRFLTWQGLLAMVVVGFLIFFGIKIRYDKVLRKWIEEVIPDAYRYLPELATEEHQRWMNDPSRCPGCGAQNVQYFEKCPSCGLSLGKARKPKSTVSTTANIKFRYTTDDHAKNSR